MSGTHPETDRNITRGFRPDFTVEYHGSQRQSQRFDGADYRIEIKRMLEANDAEAYPDDDNFDGEWSDFPRVARLRMNLTALSQHYNLYFIAYRGYVHVYRPNRTTANLVDGPPLVILDPQDSQTPVGAFTEGHVNRRCPHEVNHMIVGNLGEREILLLSRDNGDVAAWYTHDIARLAEDRLLLLQRRHQRQRRASDPANKKKTSLPARARARHFFADTVGTSAWGLAIHSASRLIAVSANTSEVTVFAFALESTEEAEQEEDEEDEEVNITPGKRPEPHKETNGDEPLTRGWDKCMRDENGIPLMSCHVAGLTPEVRRTKKSDSEAIAKLEKRFRKRHRTWRIVIPLGVEASNLPSVAFCEDEKGQADRVAAIDINGNLFIADIWRIGTKPIKIPPHNVQDLKGHRYTQISGWNVLPITDAQLRPTRTLRAAIGAPPRNAIYRGKTSRGAWLDISKSMVELANDAASFGHRDRYQMFDPLDTSSDQDNITPPNPFPQSGEPKKLSQKVFRPQFDQNDGLHIWGDRPVRLAMTMIPTTGEHRCEFKSAQALADFAAGQICTKRMLLMPKAQSLRDYRFERGFDPEGQHLLHGISFLRAYDEGVEILSLEDKDEGCGVMCHHVLTNVNLWRQTTFWDMQFGKRASMLLTIPELNLVVLGSMCGRVALLTLTQPPRRRQVDSPSGSRSSLPRTHPHRAFRVEAVLPFDVEDRSRERPYVCLLGMAVSPVPETCARGLALRKSRPAAYGGRKRKDGVSEAEEAAAASPRRWRLILNYMDHTILQYNIVDRRQYDDEEVGVMDGILNVERRAQRRSRRRRRDSSSGGGDRPPYPPGDPDDDMSEESDFEDAYFSDYDPFEDKSGKEREHGGRPHSVFGHASEMTEEDDADENDDDEEDDDENETESNDGGVEVPLAGPPLAGQQQQNTTGLVPAGAMGLWYTPDELSVGAPEDEEEEDEEDEEDG